MILVKVSNHHPPSYNGQCWETRKLPSPFKRVIRVQLSVEGQLLVCGEKESQVTVNH